MSISGLDGKDLKSWEEAFKYPIATTRQIEEQLRHDVATNKERLRTLVGSSYRDLLGTAERIVQLDGHMQQTERLLGDVNLQCNFNNIDKNADQLADIRRQNAQSKAAGRQLAAQLTLLQSCQKCLPRMFRQGGSILSAAKVIAVSRLLHKSVSQGNSSPVLLEAIGKRLASHRQHLLVRIDTVLTSPGTDFQLLTDAICAFCIITSSSSRDAVRHFQALRLDEVKQLSNLAEINQDSLLTAFSSYLQSLRTTKLLLGRQLSDAFRILRSRPLLQSQDLLALESLNLATIQQFIPTEILSFVPWVKHQDVGADETTAIIAQWSRAAFAEWSLSLRRLVKAISDVSDLLELRGQVLRVWLPTIVSTPMHSASDIFDELRTGFNARMKDILRERAGLLPDVALSIESSLESEDATSLLGSKFIWDHDLVTASLGKGAFSYRKQVTDCRLGHSETTKTILASLEKWIASASTDLEEIRGVRKVRWTDTIEEDDEDDERAEATERSLQVEDPNLYDQEHASSQQEVLLKFQTRIKDAVQSFVKDENETTEAKAIFCLRTIRGIYQQISAAMPEQDLSILSSVVPLLHTQIASKIVSEFLDPSSSSSFSISAPRSAKRKARLAAVFHLWDGSPPLPTQPSPRIFKLLQRLVTKMAAKGTDIWTPDAVETIKRTLRKEVVRNRWFKLGSDRTKTVKGDQKDQDQLSNGSGRDPAAEREASSEQEKIISVQNLYDAMYLDHALRLSDTEADDDDSDDTEHDTDTDTDTDIIHIPKQAAQPYLDDPSTSTPTPTPTSKTLHARASEHWNRTYLLFGLLDSN